MSITNTLTINALPRLPIIASPLLHRWASWLQAKLSAPTTHHTRETAESLYLRAAHYEATQPGFAADLRAAAEAMDRRPALRAG